MTEQNQTQEKGISGYLGPRISAASMLFLAVGIISALLAPLTHAAVRAALDQQGFAEAMGNWFRMIPVYGHLAIIVIYGLAFLPNLLGYIIADRPETRERRWNTGAAALLFIPGVLIEIGLLIWFWHAVHAPEGPPDAQTSIAFSLVAPFRLMLANAAWSLLALIGAVVVGRVREAQRT